MTHLAYVAAAYGVSTLAIAGLIGWIIFDQSAQKRMLKELEARGIRRRSAKAPE
ncbi:heme exporter protein CcmD [Chelativorans sp.]|uniref:heme exporter protein CcmD n=1 Tax=Chelativorans sp. TaxID=2203393 RepID=UPI00281164DF|nr:heme exporter protein CcmD [Chelativorans sp.]